MTITLNKTLVVSLAAAMLACAGPAGPEGEQGPAGPAGATGPGFEAGSSISAVVPRSVLTGGKHRVQVSGFATEWKASAAPTVSFGDGVTVSKVTVASATALIVDIDVASTAAAGTRTVTVTSGTEVAKFEAGFDLIRPLVVEGTPGVSQLGVTVVTVTNHDPAFSLPTTAAGYVSTPASGITVQFWKATAKTARFFVSADLMAATGAHDVSLEVTDAAGTKHALTFNVTVTASMVATADPMQTAGTLTAPNSSTAYKLTLAADGTFLIDASWDDTMQTSKPQFFVTDSTGSFSQLVAHSEAPAFPGLTGEDFYIVVASTDVTGGFKVTVNALVEADTEPNDTQATAQFVLLPFASSNGELTYGSDEADYYKFSLSSANVGKTLLISQVSGSADFEVEVYSADGTSLGKSGNLFYENTFSSPALTAAGVYYVRVGTFGTQYDGTYGITVDLD